MTKTKYQLMDQWFWHDPKSYKFNNKIFK